MAGKSPGPIAQNPVRRRLLLNHPTLNGIDYIEIVNDGTQRILRVAFLKAFPTPDAYGLTLPPYQVEVLGGVRERNIQVQSVTLNGANSLDIKVDRPGDFSMYILWIKSISLDQAFAQRPFTFKAGCPSDFDCDQDELEAPERYEEPAIDYMAKDYASFRQALLDFIAARNATWTERSPADLGIAMVELLAYVGDHLSYYQDAVANEAFLETARQRESVRRHARLIDYTIHDGANARTFLHVELDAGVLGVVPAGTVVLTRIEVNLGTGATPPPYGAVIPNSLKKPALQSATAPFEIVQTGRVDAAFNRLQIHTWGNQECYLPAGTTELDLRGNLALKAGDYLLLEELIGPVTGQAADRDPTRRQVVRLIADGALTLDSLPDPPGPAIPVTRVRWSKSDALTFPLYLSIRLPDGDVVTDVSVARGNILLADHGRRILPEEWHPGDPVDPSVAGIQTKAGRPYRFRLAEGPLTFRVPLPADPLAPVVDLQTGDLRTAEPQVWLNVQEPSGATIAYTAVEHLLDSGAFAANFVVETDNSGTGQIRFGNDEYGLAPPDGAFMQVSYRVGNGSAGNIGAESLVHLVVPEPALLGGATWPSSIIAVRNPLPAWGGTDAEPVAQVKRLAPTAFRSVQYRAVTPADYAAAAMTHSAISNAVATFRWTGSWYTAFVTVDPTGRSEVSSSLREQLLEHLSRYELSGYDVEIAAPVFIPLEIDIDICVKPEFFQGDVKEELLKALSSADLGGDRHGFFHPDNFTFGQSVYLSALYAAVEAVEGVESATVKTFRRWSQTDPGWLAMGRIETERTEVARLDNDPNFPENGLLRLQMRGGR